MPSVLFINRVYPPAPGATGDLLAVLAEGLASRGWRVTVIAGRPAGVQPRRTRIATACDWNGSAACPLPAPRTGRRAISYLSLYPAILWRALRLPRQDVAVFLTDPPLQFLLGTWLRLFKRQPARALGAGHLSRNSRRSWGCCAGADSIGPCFARSLAARALRRFDAVAVIGACMKDRMLARGLDPARLVVIPNWADAAAIQPVPAAGNRFRAECGVTDQFVVMYSGNFGLAHDFSGDPWRGGTACSATGRTSHVPPGGRGSAPG